MAVSKFPGNQESDEALKERRRRERLSAFFTPFLTLTSIVISVGLVLSVVKACQKRFPNNPFSTQVEHQPARDLAPVTR